MSFEEHQKKSTYPQPMSLKVLVFWTGLFGGVFWSFMGYLAYVFNFIEIKPTIILESWALGDWKKSWLGTCISIIIIGVISVGAAYLYYLLLKRLNGFWTGLGYGIALFLLVFLVLYPLFPGLGPVNQLTKDTIITCLCLYAVYGLFIGYSINYEYENHKLAKEEAEI